MTAWLFRTAWPHLREIFAVLVTGPAHQSAKQGSHLQTSLVLSVAGALLDAFAVIVGAFGPALVPELAESPGFPCGKRGALGVFGLVSLKNRK
jgi:hypothetical protein